MRLAGPKGQFLLSAIASLWDRLGHSRRRRPRVLVIDDWLPDPRIGAGAPRALAFMRALLAAGARLTLLPTLAEPENAAAARRLLPGATVARGYGRDGMGRFLSERHDRFDLIIVSRPHNMEAFRASAAGMRAFATASIVYDAEALFATREALRRDVLGEASADGQESLETESEIALADGTRMILAVNERTAAAFKAAGHANVRILGYAAKAQPTRTPFDDREGFLFVGPTYADGTPNSDSVAWFSDHVMPEIRRAMGQPVRLVLAGIQNAPQVAARVNGSLQSVGVLSDLTAAYSAARVFVAPTRFAAGIPIKVYDAAAHGVPVVLTPVLAEQIGWRHEQEVLIAESPQAFATQCLRLHRDEDLWMHVRARALARIERECDPPRFNRMVAEVLAQMDHRGQSH